VGIEAEQLVGYLAGVDYPAKKDELIATADRNAAPQDVIEALQALAEEDFPNQSAVEAALG
jgi:hypothetical protein